MPSPKLEQDLASAIMQFGALQSVAQSLKRLRMLTPVAQNYVTDALYCLNAALEEDRRVITEIAGLPERGFPLSAGPVQQ